MAIVTKKISQWGKNFKISEHFTLGEFQCKDGSDTVKYSTELLKLLEKLRSYGNFSIAINSGYRTSSYNKKIRGASNSNHIKGLAADIKVYQDGKLVPAKYICCICQDLGFPGIAMIKGGNSAHVDARTSGTYRGDETHGYTNNVGGDFYRYFNISRAKINEYNALYRADKAAKKQEAMEMDYNEFKQHMARYQKEKNSEAVSSWAEQSMKWAKNNGISDGTAPRGYCTREQVISMLYRLLNLIRG